MFVVIDTNILVSSLWSKNGAPAKVMGLVFSGQLTPCYDHRILLEYQQVLERPKFRFRPSEVNTLLDFFKQVGNSVVVPPIDIPFADQSDRKFYEVAKYCGAVLITGNLKHFPDDDKILSASSFLEMNGWAVNG